MRTLSALLVVTAAFGITVAAQQPPSEGPYKILKSAGVGGEGSWDYVYADTDARRLYIPRRGVAATPDATPPRAAVNARLTIFDLDTLAPIGEIDGVGGNGAVVDPK